MTRNVKDFLRILLQRPPEKRYAGLVLIPRSTKLDDFGAAISDLSQEAWVDRDEWMRSAQEI